MENQSIEVKPAPSPIQMQPVSDTTQFSAGVKAPTGLEYLAAVDQLLIKQKIEVLEVVMGFETVNKYEVLNSIGQSVYKAEEDTNCCNRVFCGSIRGFDMSLTDNEGQEVIHLQRPLRCQDCCFPCCLQEMEVSSPQGNIIGTITQEWSIFHPRLLIKDCLGNPVFRVQGPCMTISCCGNDVDFNVVSVETGEEIGKITKQWTGLAKEIFTDADNFGITFPLDLDVKVKATLLGALFLIDFMYFEHDA